MANVPQEFNTLYLKDVSFVNLMTRRIFNVLIVANPYDAFMLEDDGRVDEKIFDEYTELGMRYPPTFTQVSTTEEARHVLDETNIDLVICMPGTADNDAFTVAREVKSIKKWNYMMKVLKGREYASVTRNFAEFTPGPEILLRMKESLQQSGFDVVFERHAGEPESWKANCVALEYSKVNRTMTVQAKVYTPEQQAKITAINDGVTK